MMDENNILWRLMNLPPEESLQELGPLELSNMLRSTDEPLNETMRLFIEAQPDGVYH